MSNISSYAKMNQYTGSITISTPTIMNIHAHTQAAYESFLRFAGESKISLLHPDSRFRTLVVARLLADPDIHTLYYALDVDDINLRNFLTGIIRRLSLQHATFGRLLSMLPANNLDDPNKHMELVINTFIDELSEIESDSFYLILDEFDRADLADDIKRFVERLSHSAPGHCRIVLNGRSLPRMPWLSMMAKRHAIIVRDEMLVRTNFYHKPNNHDASVKVLSLGPGYVFLDDLLVDKWEGHLPRLLLFYALDRPDVTRNQICGTFWPNLDIDQAVNVFHVTKRRLHKALNLDILAHDGTYYRTDMNVPIYFDAIEFVEALLEGRYGDPDDPFELWQKVAKLYRGPYLEGHNEDWILERREAYLSAYMEALDNIAELWIKDEKYELALLTLVRAIETDFSYDEFHLKLLRLYVTLGRRAEAVAHYREMERRAKTAKTRLSDDIQQLFRDISA